MCAITVTIQRNRCVSTCIIADTNRIGGIPVQINKIIIGNVNICILYHLVEANAIMTECITIESIARNIGITHCVGLRKLQAIIHITRSITLCTKRTVCYRNLTVNAQIDSRIRRYLTRRYNNAIRHSKIAIIRNLNRNETLIRRYCTRNGMTLTV